MSEFGKVLDGRDRFPKKTAKVSIRDGRIVDVVREQVHPSNWDADRKKSWETARAKHMPDLELLRRKNKEKEEENEKINRNLERRWNSASKFNSFESLSNKRRDRGGDANFGKLLQFPDRRVYGIAPPDYTD